MSLATPKNIKAMVVGYGVVKRFLRHNLFTKIPFLVFLPKPTNQCIKSMKHETNVGIGWYIILYLHTQLIPLFFFVYFSHG